MQKIGFTEALDILLAKDGRYDREAYLFLRDALEFTVNRQKKKKGDGSRHVNAAQLVAGVRDYALKEFGPMVPTVFSFWGIHECSDIGRLVFNLIEAGIFGKTEEDMIEDFQNGFDFHEAFVKPFLPPSLAVACAPSISSLN